MTKSIDIDDPPSGVYKRFPDGAEECSGKTEYINDLPLPAEWEEPFRQELTGHFLRAYHYTRLLPWGCQHG